MKIDINGTVLDVVFNPGRKTDGRPDASLSYTASLRASAEGVVRLTLATDFTPPCLLVELPEWSLELASDVIAALGIWAPAWKAGGWTEARPGVYAFADGVSYGEPMEDELAFMASFGFVPGARFNLALPMLRAHRAGLTAGGWRAEATAVTAMEDAADEVALPTRAENMVAVAKAADAAEALTSTVHQLNAESNAAVGPKSPAVKRQRRQATRPTGTVEIVSQVLGESTEETLVPDAAIADVFDVLDNAPAPKADSVAVAPNPFMIEGL